MHSLIRTLVVAAAALLPCVASAQSAPVPRLFGPTLVVPQALGPSAARDPRTAVRDRAVSPDLAAVDRLALDHAGGRRGDRFVVDLFPGLEFEAEVIDAEVRPNGTTVFARLDVEYGSAVLTHEHGILIAAIDFPGGNYTVERDHDGHYRVTQRALHLAAPEKEPRLVFGVQRFQPFDVEPDVPVDSGRLIDVMIIWTPAAQTAAGGALAMGALAQSSIDNANLTYLNSGVAQRVRLVHSQAVTYTETTSCGSDAFDCALTAVTNGNIPNVHTLRNLHGADLVSLFISDNAYCGLAWLPFPSAATEDEGFSVVEQSCAFGNKSFVHELGHNMGAHHDPYVLGTVPSEGCADSKEKGAYCYSRGIVNLSQRWRTVLAYNNQCSATSPFTSCTRIQYLSNPKLTYTGSVLGTANLHNNAHTLNKTAKAIAAYRPTSALHPVLQRFTDVALSHPNFGHIEFLAQAGVTGGCAAGQFCPTSPVSRRHMAAFVERVMRAANYAPPAATGTVFTDVSVSTQFAAFMERLYADQITGGCAANPLRYCPDADVSRAQMAVFVLRAKCGATYFPNAPAAATFADVPTNHPQFRFVEKLVNMGITGGCASGPLRFCPDAPVTRAQMAVFLERAYPMSAPTETCAL